MIPTLSIQWKDYPINLFRIRKATNEINESLISEFWFPPVCLSQSFQRANKPLCPVLYGSDTAIGAIRETIQYENTVDSNADYYLSCWNFKPDSILMVTPFIFRNIDHSSRYGFLSNRNSEAIENIFKSHGKKRIEEVKKIMIFLGDLFVRKKTHIISSFIAHHYLYANHEARTDVFIYPSLQMDNKFLNFAIHPNAAIEKLRMSSVFKINITDLKENRKQEIEDLAYKIRIKQIAINHNSILRWENFSKSNSFHKRELEILEL